MTTRRLDADDLPALRGLNQLFAEAFADTNAYADHPPSNEYLTRTVAKPHVIVLAALAGEEVVAGLVAYELDKIEQARSEIYIYDLAVAELYRRRGIAIALIDHLRAIAIERGTWVIYVQADHGDDPAVALYTKLGTREDVMHFDIAPRR